MISMTRQQQGDFNRCCDFLARMIEKYGDSIELGTAQKVALIYEWTNASGDRIIYLILNIHVLRDNIILTLSVKGAKIWQIIL